jgi:hypothetical protein
MVKAPPLTKLPSEKHSRQKEPWGFWRQLLRSNQKPVGNIGEFDVPQLYARLRDQHKALEWLDRN